MKSFLFLIVLSAFTFVVFGQSPESMPESAEQAKVSLGFLDKVGLYVLVLFGISESLALIPALKSNSIFQLIHNSLKKIKELFLKKK